MSNREKQPWLKAAFASSDSVTTVKLHFLIDLKDEKMSFPALTDQEGFIICYNKLKQGGTAGYTVPGGIALFYMYLKLKKGVK